MKHISHTDCDDGCQHVLCTAFRTKIHIKYTNKNVQKTEICLQKMCIKNTTNQIKTGHMWNIQINICIQHNIQKCQRAPVLFFPKTEIIQQIRLLHQLVLQSEHFHLFIFWLRESQILTERKTESLCNYKQVVMDVWTMRWVLIFTSPSKTNKKRHLFVSVQSVSVITGQFVEEGK